MTLEIYCYAQSLDAGWWQQPKTTPIPNFTTNSRLRCWNPLCHLCLDAGLLLGAQPLPSWLSWSIHGLGVDRILLSKIDVSEFLQLWLRMIGASIYGNQKRCCDSETCNSSVDVWYRKMGTNGCYWGEYVNQCWGSANVLISSRGPMDSMIRN
jgi:hypothetical protein